MSDAARVRADDRTGGGVESGVRFPGAEAPYYLPIGDEIAVFETCHARRLAVML